MHSIDHIRNDLHLECDFILYNKLKKRVQLTVGNNIISEYDNLHPQLPYILHITEVGNKGNNTHILIQWIQETLF